MTLQWNLRNHNRARAWRLMRLTGEASAISWSEPHLPAPERREVLDGRAPLEVDLEVHRCKIGRRAAGEERLLLARQIGPVLRAVRRRTDIDDARVFLPRMLVGDGVADVGVPPHRVARHHFG